MDMKGSLSPALQADHHPLKWKERFLWASLLPLLSILITLGGPVSTPLQPSGG